ncbi:MAG: beta-L-arabinofuranosidase domain-containing protein [Bacteroidales bacterium]
MFRFITILLFSFLFFVQSFGQTNGLTRVQNSARSYFNAVDLGKTEWTQGFMNDVWERNKNITIPYLYERYTSPTMAGYILNFERVASGESGGYLNGGVTFSDGDLLKWMEALCYLIALDSTSSWNEVLDSLTNNINAAQERAISEMGPEFEGYFSTYDQLNGTANLCCGQQYNFGHLMTTGAIHHRVTGKVGLLNAAKKTGGFMLGLVEDALDKPWNYLAHTTIMGSIELYRETGNESFYQIGQQIIDLKGDFANSKNYQYNTQVNGILLNQTTAVGHAQRANYLYAGAIDAYMEGADTGYLAMSETIWEDITEGKMYITGGCGAIHGFNPECDHWTPQYPNPPGEPVASSCNLYVSEGYGQSFYLPNEGAYCETCAQVGMALYAWRMLQATGNAKYADILELELFNGVLSATSLDGKKFFYTNKLEKLTDNIYQQDAPTRTGSSSPEFQANPDRSNWAQCCPPNYARLMAMSPNMAYGISEEDKKIWKHLYGSNHIKTSFRDSTMVDIEELANQFPWDGRIKMLINEDGYYGFKIRIPSWSEETEIKIKGVKLEDKIVPNTYFDIENRNWSVGDTIEVNLDMKIHVVEGNPLTGEAQTNKLAIRRGPLVYCAERIDNPKSETGVSFDSLGLEKTLTFDTIWNENLNVMSIENGKTKLIPYYSWSNRSDNYMKVWMHDGNLVPDQDTGSVSSVNEYRVNSINAFPNPFTDDLQLRLNLQKDSEVSIFIQNMLGQTVKQFGQRYYGHEETAIHWDGTNDAGTAINPGIYVVIVKCINKNGQSIYNKLIVKAN